LEGDGEAGAEGKGSAHGSVSEQDEACSSNVCPDPLPSEEKHRYYEQIELDVTRSATHLGLSRDEISTLRRRLSSTLHALFRENTQFHYYQGFHDLASIILHAFDDVEMSKQVIFRVMKLFLKEAMGEDLSIANDALSLLVHLIERDDRVLAQTLCKDGVGPQFALSWLLTWFSHDVRNAHQAFRLFDSFLSSHPLLPLYTAAAIIKFRSDVILDPAHDYAEVHMLMQKLPDDLPLDVIIAQASRSFTKYPPSRAVAALALQQEMRLSRSRSWLSLPLVLSRKGTRRKREPEEERRGISAMSQEMFVVPSRRSTAGDAESMWETKKRITSMSAAISVFMFLVVSRINEYFYG